MAVDTHGQPNYGALRDEVQHTGLAWAPGKRSPPCAQTEDATALQEEEVVEEEIRGCWQLAPFFAIMFLNAGMNFAFYGALTTAQVAAARAAACGHFARCSACFLVCTRCRAVGARARGTFACAGE
jgi:hypothetical protein